MARSAVLDVVEAAPVAAVGTGTRAVVRAVVPGMGAAAGVGRVVGARDDRRSAYALGVRRTRPSWAPDIVRKPRQSKQQTIGRSMEAGTQIDDPAFLAAMKALVRDRHRTLVRLVLEGRSAQQIADRVGFARASTVDLTKRRPDVRAALEAGRDYMTRLWAQNQVIPDWMVKKPLQEMVGPALTILAENMGSQDEKVRHRAALDVLKLAGVKVQPAPAAPNGANEVGSDVLRGLLESIKAVQAEGDGGDPVA